MSYRYFISKGAVAVVIAFAIGCTAGEQTAPAAGVDDAAESTFAPTRTPWGDPDLQGIWRNLEAMPLERPREFGDRAYLTDAEFAARVEAQNERNRKILAGEDVIDDGEVTQGFSYNTIFFYPDAKVRISRRTSAIVDPPNGRFPAWTAQQLSRWDARERASRGRGLADSWEDRRPGERCLGTVNMLFEPASSGAPAGREILQMPGYVAMVIESHNGYDYRVIPLDGRPAPSPKIRQWLGDARGRWEGDTLVVEITNVNAKQDGGPFVPVNRAGMGTVYPGSGEGLRVIERWKRVGPEKLEYQYTVDDPQTYERPYTVLHELSMDSEYTVFFASACHEGNSGLAGQLASARADEKAALEAAEEAARVRQQQLEALKAEWAGTSAVLPGQQATKVEDER